MACVPLIGHPQAAPTAQQLFAAERWPELVQLLEKVPQRTAEEDFQYGIALANIGRLEDARRTLLQGSHLQPHDKRFLSEAAGVEFKQKRYGAAAAHLRQVLAYDPKAANVDAEYANDFLATIYYVQGNVEAAVKFWNRLPQPRPTISAVRNEPKLRIRPALLDHALAFSPASVLTLEQLRTSEARVRNLGIFPNYRLDLVSVDGGKFDGVVRARELNGFGNTKFEALLRTFSGLPNQEITPEYYNLHGSATNIVSAFRWDSDKRRARIALSGPLGWHGTGDPRWRYRLSAEVRNENWDIRNGFTGPAPILESLNLRHEEYLAEIRRVVGWRWRWTLGVDVSHRDFRNVVQGSVPGGVLTPQMLAAGYQVKQRATVDYQIWRSAERRIFISTGLNSQAGRVWSAPAESFEKLQGSFNFHWLPEVKGDDYETQWTVRGGKTFGDVPFDELFMLGLGADNDLLMRAHVGTRRGRKGSAPLGRDYVLSNWETDKNIYSNGVIAVKLGPFVDTGRITDPDPLLTQRKLLVDAGAQAKVRVLGVGVVFSYGKDLRTGNNEFFATIGR